MSSPRKGGSGGGKASGDRPGTREEAAEAALAGSHDVIPSPSCPRTPGPGAPAPLGGASHRGVGEGARKARGLEGGRPGGGGSPVHALRGPQPGEKVRSREAGSAKRQARAPHRDLGEAPPPPARPVPSAK